MSRAVLWPRWLRTAFSYLLTSDIFIASHSLRVKLDSEKQPSFPEYVFDRVQDAHRMSWFVRGESEMRSREPQLQGRHVLGSRASLGSHNSVALERRQSTHTQEQMWHAFIQWVYYRQTFPGAIGTYSMKSWCKTLAFSGPEFWRGWSNTDQIRHAYDKSKFPLEY